MGAPLATLTPLLGPQAPLPRSGIHLIVSFVNASELLQRITIDPRICHGKPCVRGLRYPVEFLLELLSGGMTVDQVLADYPDLEPDDLKAVYAYAAQLSRVQRVEPIAV